MKLRDRLGKHMAEELQNVIAHEGRGGLWPGDTISHGTARDLCVRGLIKRNPQGNWIPRWDLISLGADGVIAP